MSRRGRFITLEGGEGAGKSVQARRLEARLERVGLEVVRTREPGGSPHAEVLREVILSGFARPFGAEGEALLFAAARIDHLDATILPALERGAWVVCDRFAEFDPRLSGRRRRLAARHDRRSRTGRRRSELAGPDADPRHSARDRASSGRASDGGREGRTDSKAEGIGFHRILRRAYLDIAAAEPERCAVIDALKSEDEVEADIWAAVEARLDPGGAAKPPP